MNYSQIERMSRKGVAFFTDQSRPMNLIKQGEYGYDESGFEIPPMEQVIPISGATRRPKAREIDGETILASDILGIFNNDHEINQGDFIEIDGIRFVVTDSRQVQASLEPVAYRPVLRRVSVGG